MRTLPRLSVLTQEHTARVTEDHLDANRRYITALTHLTREETLEWTCANLEAMQSDIALPLLFVADHEAGKLLLIVSPSAHLFWNDPSDPDAGAYMNFSLTMEERGQYTICIGNSHNIGIDVSEDVTRNPAYASTSSFALLHDAILAQLRIIPRCDLPHQPEVSVNFSLTRPSEPYHFIDSPLLGYDSAI